MQVACARFLCLAFAAMGPVSLALGDELNLQGSADGFFNAGPGTAYGGLTYLGSTFNVTTASGFYALGGNAGVPNLNNLGSLTLDSSAFNYNSPPSMITLDVTFTAPTGINISSTAVFVSDLVGQVGSDGSGGVHLDFGSTPHLFSFSNASGTGTFSLVVNPVSIHPGQTVSISGYGTGRIEAVPEPSSIACIALGLVGLLAKRKRARGSALA